MDTVQRHIRNFNTNIQYCHKWGCVLLNTDKEKDSYFRFRIDMETKEKFQQITKRKAINVSELFRMWINDYIKENQ